MEAIAANDAALRSSSEDHPSLLSSSLVLLKAVKVLKDPAMRREAAALVDAIDSTALDLHSLAKTVGAHASNDRDDACGAASAAEAGAGAATSGAADVLWSSGGSLSDPAAALSTFVACLRANPKIKNKLSARRFQFALVLESIEEATGGPTAEGLGAKVGREDLFTGTTRAREETRVHFI